MVKAETKKNKQQKSKKRLWILAVLAFAVVAAIAAWGVSAYTSHMQYEKDRQRFMLVKDDIETLTTELNKVDESIQWESEATCRRSSVKYDEGLAACTVDTEAAVVVNSDSEAKDLIRDYNKALLDATQHLEIIPTREYSSSSSSPRFPIELAPGFGGQGFWSNEGNMVCGSLFRIKDTFYGAPPSNTLEMSFACNDTTEDTWFHVPTYREMMDGQKEE